MLIQLERISAQRIRVGAVRCTVPRCSAAATWILVDLDIPEHSEANVGELACCAAHITATYLNLRGANVVSRGESRDKTSRPWVDRRRRPKRLSISGAGGRM